MVGDNPSPYCQDGIRSASIMLFWWHHVTTTDDEYVPTIQLYQRVDLTPCCWDASKKAVEGLSWQHFNIMKLEDAQFNFYIYNKFESFSSFIIIIYLVFIRIREPSCDFVNYLMKFTNWRERKNRPVFERLI